MEALATRYMLATSIFLDHDTTFRTWFFKKQVMNVVHVTKVKGFYPFAAFSQFLTSGKM